jgi:hypothetical protein
MKKETLDSITMTNFQDYIEMKEAEREYEMFEKMFEPNAIDRINKIYHQAIQDLENLIK